MIEIAESMAIVAGTAGITALLISYIYIMKCSKPPSHGNGGHRKYKTAL